MQHPFRTARRALTLALALAAMPAVAQERPFSRTIFFGDSLTDAGFFRPALIRAAGPQAAILGKFTTNPGLVWSEHVANHYGSNAAPAGNVRGGNNYAAGGARVALDTSGALGFTPSIATQVQSYLAAAGGRADPNALYTLWGGANEIFAATGAPEQAAQIVGEAVAAQVGVAAALRAAGAQYLLVPSIPDIGATPGFRAQGAPAQAAGTALSSAYNQALFTALADQGVQVIPVDTFALLNEVTADPGRYGIANVTATACQPQISAQSISCNPGTYASADAPDSHLYADGVHPTSAGHALMAQAALAMIEGPRQVAVLPHSAVVLGRSRASVVGAQAQAASAGEQRGRWWADVRLDNQRYGAGDSADLYDGAGGTLTAGIDWGRAGLAYGAFAGFGRQNLSWGLRRGDFDQEDVSLGGYLGWRRGHAWVDGQLAYTRLSYDIQRKVQLGPATRGYASATDGRNISAGIEAGWDFERGQLRHGPVLGLLAQRVKVEGFSERRAADSTALAFPDQRFDSLLGSIGWRLHYQASDTFQPFARLLWEHEFEDAPRHVHARASSVPVTLRYAVPGLNFDDDYGLLSVGNQMRLGGVELTAGASVTFAQAEGNDANVFVNLRRAF